MDKRVIPWQGLLTSDRRHHERGGHPLLDKIYASAVSYLEDSTPVCSRISRHSEFATLPRYFNILYQSFMPNCKLSVDVLRCYYSIPKQVASFICSGRNTRVCNQRVLTFLLTEFEKDFDFLRFCAVIEELIQLPVLRKIADRLRDAFPERTKADVVQEDDQDNSELSLDKKFQCGASCLHSNSVKDEIVNTSVEETGVLSAPINTIQRNRRRCLVDAHSPLESQIITESASVVHESMDGIVDGHLQLTATSRGDFAVSTTLSSVSSSVDTTLSLDSHMQEHDSLTTPAQHFDLTSGDSEEVKSKISAQSLDFERSNSSDASSPAMLLASPNRDHLSSPTEGGPYRANLLTDRPLLQAASTTPVGTEIPVVLKPSASAAAYADSTRSVAALLESKGFEPLRQRYNSLYQSFPHDFMVTVNKLEQHLTDVDISSLLACSDAMLANKKLLDCLIICMKCKEDILDLCDRLEKISDSSSMNNIIRDLHDDVVRTIQKDAAATHLPSKHDGVMMDDAEPDIHSMLRVSLDPKVIALLKKYYNTLCHSLSANRMRNAATLASYGLCSDSLISQLKASDSTLKANQLLINWLIGCIDYEGRLVDVCDVIDKMITDKELKHNVESFRNEVLSVLSNKPSGSAEWGYTSKQVRLVRGGTRATQCAAGVASTAGTTNATCFRVAAILSPADAHGIADTELDENFLQPPSVPQYYVKRLKLEEELANAVLENNRDESAVTVTITGDSGFGKSTLAKAFCHNENIKQLFPSGFLVIELGPNTSNSLLKLIRIYQNLTHGARVDGDINSIVQMLHTVVVKNYPNILVIIDDVCSAHDAQPFVMAFRSCKIVVTTKVEEVSKQLSSSKVVTVGPMEPLEAIKLLSSCIPTQISEDDKRIVWELVNDLHLCPLLICLARGQLQITQSEVKTMGDLQSVLYRKGLEHIPYIVSKGDLHGRKVAATACIEANLNSLSVDESDQLNHLAHHTGVSGSVAFHCLLHIWNLPEADCLQLLTKFESMGLVAFSHAAYGTKATVKIHSIISQYLIDSQVYNPPQHLNDTQEEMINPASTTILLFSRPANASLNEKVVGTPEWCIKNSLESTEKSSLPQYFKRITSNIAFWAARLLSLIESAYSVACHSPNKFADLVSLESEGDMLSCECQSIMMDYVKEIEQLNEQVNALLKVKDYDNINKTLEQYFTNYPMRKIALQTKGFVDKVVSRCDHKYKHSLKVLSEFLYCFTPEYDYMLKLDLPQLKLILDMHKKLTTALASGPAAIEEASEELWSPVVSEQSGLLIDNYMIKLQEVAPHHVSEFSILAPKDELD